MSASRQQAFTLKAKTALLQRGETITSLALRLGLARNTVSLAINHPTMMPRVQARITQALALS